MKEETCRVKKASGATNGCPFEPITYKRTDCLHSAAQQVYTVAIGERLVVLCDVCYASYQRGIEVVIYRRRR